LSLHSPLAIFVQYRILYIVDAVKDIIRYMLRPFSDDTRRSTIIIEHNKKRYWLMNGLFFKLLKMVGLGRKENDAASIDNTTVKSLDLNRFMGLWYEIARYDHLFERNMTHVTATYTLKPDGRIVVVNDGYLKGIHKIIKGKAKLPDSIEPGKLKVSFFLWFYADYYVLDISPDYSYVVIGSSSPDYLWIMSRTSSLPDETMQKILSDLRTRGYDTSKLINVKQA